MVDTAEPSQKSNMKKDLFKQIYSVFKMIIKYGTILIVIIDVAKFINGRLESFFPDLKDEPAPAQPVPDYPHDHEYTDFHDVEFTKTNDPQ